MATLKQKKVAKAIVENFDADKPSTAGEILENIGYSHSTATHSPKEIFESEGVKTELIKLGFNNETADQVVSEILLAGENDNVKLKAADMVYKRTGGYAPVKALVAHVELDVPPEIQELAHDLITNQRTATSSD